MVSSGPADPASGPDPKSYRHMNEFMHRNPYGALEAFSVPALVK